MNASRKWGLISVLFAGVAFGLMSWSLATAIIQSPGWGWQWLALALASNKCVDWANQATAHANKLASREVTE